MKKKNQQIRWIMVIAGLLLLLNFIFPLWHIHLIAPQYPDGVGLYIYINKLAGEEPGHIQNIDILNHYVGMKPLPKSLPEFHLFPAVIIGMAIFAFLTALFYRPYLLIAWITLFAILGVVGLYDFYHWLYEYGTNLDPNAPIKLLDPEGNPMTYVPPLLGVKQLLNFTVSSYPALGGYAALLSFLLGLLACYQSCFKKEKVPSTAIAILTLFGISSLISCSASIDPIEYGKDQCDYCKMTIADPHFAAQIVTTKGKNYKFDAIECMVHFIQESPDMKLKYLLVSDYLTEKLVEAQKATYLISEKINSPMGASLCAFESKQEAEKFLKQLGTGQIFTWDQLQEALRAQNVQ